MIDQTHILFSMFSFFIAGILLAFTPCVLPMVPILSSVLVGQEKQNTIQTFKLSFTFVLSMAITYAGAGLLAGYLGSTVQTAMQSPWIIVSFSLIFVLMGMSMFGLFNLHVPRFIQNRLLKLSNKQKGGSLIGVAIMGFLSTLIASPCVTAPLVTVLTYIGQTGNAFFGGIILFSLALGMGLPLLIFGMGQGVLLPKSGAWMNKVKYLFGVMMLGLAIWMISRLLPDVVILFLWSLLFIISAIAFGALNFRTEKRLPPLLHGISIFVLTYGCLLLIGAMSGHENMWKPLASHNVVSNGDEKVVPPAELFTSVNDLSELQEKLNFAKKNKKPVMLEFYASWCPACRSLDNNVLSDATVQKHLKNFMAIRVDITNRDEEAMKLVSYFQVYGTPTIIFYDQNGKAIDTGSLNEGITKEELDGFLVATVK